MTADHDEVPEGHDEHRLHGLRPGSHDRDAAAHASRRGLGASATAPRRAGSVARSWADAPGWAPAAAASRAASSSCRAVSSGSGRSSRSMTSHARREPDEREDEGAAQLGQAERPGEGRPGTDEVGPDHRADRRGPDDDRRGPGHGASGSREVGGGIPRLVVGGGAAAEEEHADDEERERARPRRPRARAPAPTKARLRPSRSPSRRPRAAVARATGIVMRAVPSTCAVVPTPASASLPLELLGEQRADGDAGRHADTAEHLRRDEGADDPALQGWRRSAATGASDHVGGSHVSS